MSEFVLLYRSAPDSIDENMEETEQGRERLGRWRAWMEGIRQKGQLKDRGLPLRRAGKVVRGRRAIVDGPFMETKEVVGGFSVIEAKDLAEAAAIAAECPIVEGGGSVEVRPIMRFTA